jgi:hypothetical protein
MSRLLRVNIDKLAEAVATIPQMELTHQQISNLTVQYHSGKMKRKMNR